MTLALYLVQVWGAGRFNGRGTHSSMRHELWCMRQLPGDAKRPENEGIRQVVLRRLSATREKLLLHEKAV